MQHTQGRNVVHILKALIPEKREDTYKSEKGKTVFLGKH